MSGFYQPHLLTYLDEVGIAVDCIINLETKDSLAAPLPAADDDRTAGKNLGFFYVF